MKTLFIVLFNVCENGRVVSSVPSIFFFESEEEAHTYANKYVKNSSTFSSYGISDIMPYKV